MRSFNHSNKKTASCEICILAGGLGARMGCDKSRLRLGTRTVLARIRSTARATGYRVRVLRRDMVERCGPLGGVYTALKKSRAEAVLFLACDMPFVSEDLLRRLSKASGPRFRAVFTEHDGKVGFPLVLPRTALPLVEALIRRGRFSLQSLAETVGAARFRPSVRLQGDLENVNTPEDFKRARQIEERRSRNRRTR